MKIPLVSKLRWLKKFVAHAAASDNVMTDLYDKASHQSQRAHKWLDGASLSDAKNAHYTNTVQEMTTGLSRDYNFLEGDVWLEGGVRRIPVLDIFREPIMAHDPDDVDGLTLGEWLDIGKAAGKGLKIDIKQSASIPKVIEAVKERQLPDQRLIFNADVSFGPGIEKDLKFRALDLATDFTSDLSEMKQIRKAFPESTLGLGLYTKAQPKGTVYSREQLGEVIKFAQQVGGPITFPLRAEFVTPSVVERLKPYGSVSIWNDPKTFEPGDKAIAERRFRDMGVDGMVDLRANSEPKKGPIYDRDFWPPNPKEDPITEGYLTSPNS